MTAVQQAEREKNWAAQSSVFAAVGLTAFKVAVGFASGSLGILAEAAHSGLDLVAALATLFAVRLASRPADRNHLYGHGKIENLSALFETGLLILTCFWILFEAGKRLYFRHVEIEITVWAFVVMAVSIVVDFSRSRMLYRAARKHNSQALEADALHFQTDIWSSSVVILGLFCVKISDWVPNAEYLHYADAVAAIVVAIIALTVSVRLGMRTVSNLLDEAPPGMEERIIAAVEAVPAVSNCHNVRLRSSGAQTFVDVHVLIDGNRTLHEAHAMTEDVERAIQAILPNADVTVHPEPHE